MDERFYTPRATASSSRSLSSFGTPRNSLHDTDDDSFRTPRSQSSVAPVGRRSRKFSYSNNDRYREPVLSSSSSSWASAGQEVQQRLQYDPEAGSNSKYCEPKDPPNIFSLARHGRSGELEELLLRGIPVDSVDENGNSILAIGAQNGKVKQVHLLFMLLNQTALQHLFF